jgi:hypothetical protein
MSLVFTLSGCPPTEELIDVESMPIGEPLFNLPENVHIISELFDFSTYDEHTLGYKVFSDTMVVTSTYILQNDGNDEIVDFFIPFYSVSSIDISKLRDELSIKVNEQEQDVSWHLGMDYEHLLNYEKYNYNHIEDALIDDSMYGFDDYIYTYEFTAPLKGENQELTISVPEGTKMITDYYSHKTGDISYAQGELFQYTGSVMEIESFELLTTGRIYTIGEEAVFTGNYDYSLASGPKEIPRFIEHRCYDEYSCALQKNAYHNFIRSNDLYISSSDLNEQYNYRVETLSVFKSPVLVQGGGSHTEVEISYKIVGGAYSEEETLDSDGNVIKEKATYIYYDFYLASDRYINGNIPVTFSMNSVYPFDKANHSFSDQEIFIYHSDDKNLIHFVVKTQFYTW